MGLTAWDPGEHSGFARNPGEAGGICLALADEERWGLYHLEGLHEPTGQTRHCTLHHASLTTQVSFVAVQRTWILKFQGRR